MIWLDRVKWSVIALLLTDIGNVYLETIHFEVEPFLLFLEKGSNVLFLLFSSSSVQYFFVDNHKKFNFILYFVCSWQINLIDRLFVCNWIFYYYLM